MILQPKAWIHFVAIGGTGMGALAGLLKSQGFRVTGSDGPLYPPMSTYIESLRIPLVTEYAAKNVEGQTWGFADAAPALVIVGNAISRGNVEAQAVELLLGAHGTVRMSFAQALAEFEIGEKKSFVVAGTHGKTTTTSFLAWMLECAGRDPGFFIGGIPVNFGQGCRPGGPACFVTEGDEYDTAYWDKESKFLHYRPDWVLCTGIEFDHADIFKDLAAVESAFKKLIGKTKRGWLLIDETSAPRPASVAVVADQLKSAGLECHRYGAHPDSTYRLMSCEGAPLPWASDERGAKIEALIGSHGRQVFYSPSVGVHNALNLLGVLATMHAAGELPSFDGVQTALQGFRGIKRRQEERFRSRRLVVIDDFAHHPTAIRETIAAIRTRYPDYHLAAFFEARSATSARNILEREMSEAFDGADSIYLMPPTKTNIPEAEKLDITHLGRDIAERPKNAGKRLVIAGSHDEIGTTFLSDFQGRERARTVALLMSNGPFGGLHTRIWNLSREVATPSGA